MTATAATSMLVALCLWWWLLLAQPSVPAVGVVVAHQELAAPRLVVGAEVRTTLCSNGGAASGMVHGLGMQSWSLVGAGLRPHPARVGWLGCWLQGRIFSHLGPKTLSSGCLVRPLSFAFSPYVALAQTQL